MDPVRRRLPQAGGAGRASGAASRAAIVLALPFWLAACSPPGWIDPAEWFSGPTAPPERIAAVDGVDHPLGSPGHRRAPPVNQRRADDDRFDPGGHHGGLCAGLGAAIVGDRSRAVRLRVVALGAIEDDVGRRVNEPSSNGCRGLGNVAGSGHVHAMQVFALPWIEGGGVNDDLGPELRDQALHGRVVADIESAPRDAWLAGRVRGEGGGCVPFVSRQSGYPTADVAAASGDEYARFSHQVIVGERRCARSGRSHSHLDGPLYNSARLAVWRASHNYRYSGSVSRCG